MINDKLELLSMAEQFMVSKRNDGGYDIDHKTENIGAVVFINGEIQYYVTGIYNSGTDWAEIDIEALNDLKRFCEMMAK